jgi:hypothetical protein
LAQNPKYFPLYKSDPGAKQAGFRLNGLYVQKGATKADATHCAIFYSNGAFLDAIGVNNSRVNVDNEQELMKHLMLVNQMVNIHYYYYWGFYTIRGDTITTQMLKYRRGMFAWKSYEEKWLLKGGRLRKLSEHPQRISIWDRLPENSSPDTTAYVFHPWPVKPDSTLAWFFYKPWFQESIKERGLK